MLHFNLIGIIKKIQQREVQFPIYLLSKNQTRVVETLAQDTTEMPASPIRMSGSSTSYPASRQSSCQAGGDGSGAWVLPTQVGGPEVQALGFGLDSLSCCKHLQNKSDDEELS